MPLRCNALVANGVWFCSLLGCPGGAAATKSRACKGLVNHASESQGGILSTLPYHKALEVSLVNVWPVVYRIQLLNIGVSWACGAGKRGTVRGTARTAQDSAGQRMY